MLILKNYKLNGATPQIVSYRLDNENIVVMNKNIVIVDTDIDYKNPILVKKDGIPFPLMIDKSTLESLTKEEGESNE